MENKQAVANSQAAVSRDETAVAPRVDVYENKDELLIVADLPGARQDDVAIHLDKGRLTIDAKRNDREDAKLLAAEFKPAAYRRAFSVPDGIDGEKVSAELREGVLRVHLPKSEALKPRQIAVRGG
jgi:HSP20 family molecular chaperone IbpA